MSITFFCSNPQCEKKVKAPEGSEGRKARCPYCQTSQRVPTPAPAVSADAGMPLGLKPGLGGGIDLTPIAEEPAPAPAGKKLYTPYTGSDVKVHRQVVAAWMSPASKPAARKPAKAESSVGEYSVGDVDDNPAHERIVTASAAANATAKGKKR